DHLGSLLGRAADAATVPYSKSSQLEKVALHRNVLHVGRCSTGGGGGSGGEYDFDSGPRTADRLGGGSGEDRDMLMGLASTLGVQVGYCDGSDDDDSDGGGSGGGGGDAYISDGGVGGGGVGGSGNNMLQMFEEANVTLAGPICARANEAVTAAITDPLRMTPPALAPLPLAAPHQLWASTQPNERTTPGGGFACDPTDTATATAADIASFGFHSPQQQQQQQQAFTISLDGMAPGASAPLPRKLDAELHSSPLASSAGVQQFSTNSARLPAPFARSSFRDSGRQLPVMPEHLAEAETEARTAAMTLPGRRSPAWVVRRINEAKQEKLISEVSTWLRAALQQRAYRRALEDSTWTPAFTEAGGGADPGGTAGRS
ncbi:hypothetical protein Vretimale_19125, partial [Volvox reticuliferus]